MLNAEQSRNFDRCQRLSVYLNANTLVYSTYNPFKRGVNGFNTNFSLFKDYATQKNTDGTSITTIQKELKNKIGMNVADVCSTATAYAEEQGNLKLAAAMRYRKTDVLKCKDPDVYGLVLGIVNALQPLMSDEQFAEFGITQGMLGSVMDDATTFSNNLGTASVADSNSSIANQKINDVIKLLDRNVKQLDRLISKFAATHPDFVAGYYINAALENPGTRHTSIEGTVTIAATGQPVRDANVAIIGTNKDAITDLLGNFAIVRMYGGDYEVAVSVPGIAIKTLTVRVQQGKTAKLNIAL